MSTGQRSELPLPDYDQLSAGTIEHRIRALEPEALERLLRYERDHADRAPVIDVITARLGQLESGGTPSPGGPDLRSVPPAPEGGSQVTPETSPEPIHPPPHGTADQPGKPKGDRP